MAELFSSFDPNVSVFSYVVSANWASAFNMILMLPQPLWLASSSPMMSVHDMMSYLGSELSAVFGPLSLPGTIFFFISTFMFVLMSNFMGLFPYIFTSTSHLTMTLSLALPLWLGGMAWALMYQFNTVLAHFVPSGTPVALMPLMVIIETVSSIIRPGTLSVRLAANMVAGHLLLTLLSSQGPNTSGVVLMCLMLGLMLLLILEVGVACIQAYVFTVLSALYLNEVSSVGFNKTMTL